MHLVCVGVVAKQNKWFRPPPVFKQDDMFRQASRLKKNKAETCGAARREVSAESYGGEGCTQAMPTQM